MGLLKICTRCNTAKPRTIDVFPLHKKTRDGLDSWCRACRSTKRSETRRGKYRHMISDEALQSLLNTQRVCVICGKDGPKLSVDHCHTKNIVRGMLCMNCNQGLGKFKDDPDLLEFARVYLLITRGDPMAKAVPNNPKLWSTAKAAAKAKFDVYPSAYANAWAAKEYKRKGGTWSGANNKVTKK